MEPLAKRKRQSGGAGRICELRVPSATNQSRVRVLFRIDSAATIAMLPARAALLPISYPCEPGFEAEISKDSPGAKNQKGRPKAAFP